MVGRKSSFYHYDIRGSVTNIVREDGSLIEGYTYDEFGNKVTTEYDENGNPITNPNSEVFENEVTFTSSITDTSTGLQYMNARYYDSSTGRFLSQDTYSGNAYEPWTQHLYSYCGNNPVNMIDPTGHSTKYISASDYNSQLTGLNDELLQRNRLAAGYYKTMNQYQNYVNRGFTEYQSMVDLAYAGWNKYQNLAQETVDKISSLRDRRQQSIKVEDAEINTYEHEIDAAAAFYQGGAVAATQRDGVEYSCLIYKTIVPVKNQSGDISSGTRYTKSAPYKGTPNFIGLAASAVAVNGIIPGVSCAHTHVYGQAADGITYDHNHFSNISPGVDDMWFARTIVDNIYLANADPASKRNIYRCMKMDLC